MNVAVPSALPSAVPSALPAQGTITEHTVAALPAGKDTVVWDRVLTGFGIRVYPSGAKVYVVQARGPQGTKRITWAATGVIGAAEARRRAALIIARIRAGEAPVPEAQKTESITVAALAPALPARARAVRCKPTTAASTASPSSATSCPPSAPVRSHPRPFAGGRPAAFTQRSPGHGQPGDRDPLAHDRPGYGWAWAGEMTKPLPLRPQVPDTPA